MTYEDATRYVGYVLDDSLNARKIDRTLSIGSTFGKNKPVLIGWQCGPEPMFVAVYSYLDVRITLSEAEEIASDYLGEIKWFPNGPAPADFRIRSY